MEKIYLGYVIIVLTKLNTIKDNKPLKLKFDIENPKLKEL